MKLDTSSAISSPGDLYFSISLSSILRFNVELFFINLVKKQASSTGTIQTVTTPQSLKTVKMENIIMPKPLFDKPNTAFFKLRRDIKMQKLKGWPNYYKYDVIKQTLPIEIPKNDFAKDDSIANWLPNDDYILLSVNIRSNIPHYLFSIYKLISIFY